MGQYLADLDKAGVLTGDKTPATLEGLKEVIAEAEDDLVTGNAEIAAVQLFKVIESPRYAKFDYAPEYAIAELTLARALIRSGAYKSAERYLLRVLGRGTKSPAFAPAYRALVDIALETHEQTEILAVLDQFGQDFAARGGVMPRDSEKEHTYLAAKVAYEAGDTSRAEALFSNIDRQSRFYAAALYFRGLIQARQGHYASARRNLWRDRRAGRSEPRSPSSSTAATTASRISRTSRSDASRTSRRSTTTRTTSISASPRIRSGCPTRCSRRPGRCSRRASTRQRTRSWRSSTGRSARRRSRPTCCCCMR